MRWQTSTGCEIQAPLRRRGFPTGHQGTGLERPAYRQAPRCGGETGVSVPSKSHLSAKHVFHGRNFETAGISIRVVVWARPKMSNLQAAPTGVAHHSSRRLKDDCNFKVSVSICPIRRVTPYRRRIHSAGHDGFRCVDCRGKKRHTRAHSSQAFIADRKWIGRREYQLAA